MSRIGRMPITVPAGVEVTIAENNVVTVKGPKGTLVQALRPEMILEQDGNVIHVKRPSDDKLHCALHGMTRALLHNMVVGVSEGFKKELEINGVGYRAAKEGKELVMNLGYSHPVKVPEIDGITIDVPASNMKKSIAQILLDEGYIKSFQIVDDGTQGTIRITLKYNAGKEKLISGLRRVSKPGLRVYVGADELPRVLRGLGIAIVSTSKGVMTDKAARAAHVGGEVLAFVW